LNPPAGVDGELSDAQSSSRWQVREQVMLVERWHTPVSTIENGRHVSPLSHWEVEEHSPDAGRGGGEEDVEDVLQPERPSIEASAKATLAGIMAGRQQIPGRTRPRWGMTAQVRVPRGTSTRETGAWTSVPCARGPTSP
jgi:hypothetical protein